MNCIICNRKNARLEIKEFLYNGGKFTVCGDCKRQYNNHDLENISIKIEKNGRYNLERHERRK